MLGFLKVIKNKVIIFVALISISAGALIILTGMTLYKMRLDNLNVDENLNYNSYKYHYALVSEESDAPFGKQFMMEP